MANKKLDEALRVLEDVLLEDGQTPEVVRQVATWVMNPALVAVVLREAPDWLGREDGTLQCCEAGDVDFHHPHCVLADALRVLVPGWAASELEVAHGSALWEKADMEKRRLSRAYYEGRMSAEELERLFLTTFGYSARLEDLKP
jgi:hypothetical protein